MSLMVLFLIIELGFMVVLFCFFCVVVNGLGGEGDGGGGRGGGGFCIYFSC